MSQWAAGCTEGTGRGHHSTAWFLSTGRKLESPGNYRRDLPTDKMPAHSGLWAIVLTADVFVYPESPASTSMSVSCSRFQTLICFDL